MADKRLDGLRVAILATDGFEESELLEPREALEEAGATTMLIAPKKGDILGMRHNEKAASVKADMTLDEASAASFDAVLLPGGALNADHLRAEKKARDFVRDIDAAGKPIAVICHGPWLLVSAGLARGRRLTSYHTIQDDIRNAGGEWQDTEVLRDRNWVSSRKPDDIPAFNRETINLFAEQTAAKRRPAA